MKYTVTEVKEKKVSPECSFAIGLFKKIKRREEVTELLEEELQGWLQMVSDEDMDVYVEVTNEILKRNS